MLGIHGYYWLAPVITASVWLTNIVGLLGLWSHDGFPEYKAEEASVVFISDVGAAHHAFFIIFSALTMVFYDITVLIERHLRHQRRIPGSVVKQQTSLDIASLVFAIAGSICLLMLSIFDAFDYSTVHWAMTLLFVVFVAISVFLQAWMIFSLSKDHYRVKHLRIIATIKVVLLGFAVCCAIGFVVGYAICSGNAYPGNGHCNASVSTAAVFEWIVSFVLFFFFLTYIVDLWPAHKRAQKGLTEDGTMVENRALAEKAGEGHRPEAPYAIAREMGPDHTAQQYESAGATHVDPQQAQGLHAYGDAQTLPNPHANATNGADPYPTYENSSGRNSVMVPPMTEARHGVL